MIRHVVLCKLDKSVTSGHIELLKGKLMSLSEDIDGICELTFGSNDSSEDLNRGYDYIFTMDFLNEKYRDAYLDHPRHKQISKEFIKPILTSSEDSILVFDYELNEER